MADYNINFPKLGAGLTLMSMWQKGKKGDGYRFLLGKDDVPIYFVWLDDSVFPGKLELKYTEYRYCSVKSPTHVKNRNYNYYLSTMHCESEFDDFIKEYEGSDPLVPENLSSMMHVDYSRVNYKLIEKV